MSTQNQIYQKESIEEQRNVITTSNYTYPHWPYHPHQSIPTRNTEVWTLEKAAKVIEGHIKDNIEIINREKDQVYKMASHYEYVRDHSVEIANIKADVTQREAANKIYEHCLRIVKGEQKY